jgi:RNAse (barnase) inhibitor barstar
MALFTNDDFERLDYSLLQNSFAVLYFRAQVLAEDIAGLKKLGYSVIEFDSSSWKSESDFYEAIAAGLTFPDYFGRNLNALSDCLIDIEIPCDSGLAIVFSKFDSFQASFPDFAWEVLDIISVKARRHLLFGRRLICLLQSDDPKLSFKEVGAQPVIWNNREWLNKARNL